MDVQLREFFVQSYTGWHLLPILRRMAGWILKTAEDLKAATEPLSAAIANVPA